MAPQGTLHYPYSVVYDRVNSTWVEGNQSFDRASWFEGGPVAACTEFNQGNDYVPTEIRGAQTMRLPSPTQSRQRNSTLKNHESGETQPPKLASLTQPPNPTSPTTKVDPRQVYPQQEWRSSASNPTSLTNSAPKVNKSNHRSGEIQHPNPISPTAKVASKILPPKPVRTPTIPPEPLHSTHIPEITCNAIETRTDCSESRINRVRNRRYD